MMTDLNYFMAWVALRAWENRRAYMDKWRAENKEAVVAYRKRVLAEHGDTIRAGRRAKYNANVEAERAKARAYYQSHIEAKRERGRRQYWNDPDAAKRQRREWYYANREKSIAVTVAWQKKNPDKVRETDRRRSKKRYYGDPQYKLVSLFRSRLHGLIKGDRKQTSKLRIDRDELVAYLESKFLPGMTWQNHGKMWHVDHIIPCAAFDFTKPREVQKCFALSNLQPLWAKDNLKKGAKLPTQTEMSLFSQTAA
jgi:hypothetical protein